MLAMKKAQNDKFRLFSITSSVDHGASHQSALTRYSNPSLESSAHSSIPIFYNLFIGKKEDIPWVAKLMREQLESNFIPGIHGPVLVNSIGPVSNLSTLQLPPSIDARLVKHYSQGDEVLTLHDLWQYCRRNDTHLQQRVIYLHSKGSYNPKKENDQLRAYLTRGALSRECSTMPIDKCSVCSSRMSPMPHPHTPGNMWLSRCDYVRQLIDPQQFTEAMQRVITKWKMLGQRAFCMGYDRYAVEHWVHSHPTVQPCDVDGSSNYVWNYDGIPDTNFSLDLQPAPRFRPYSVFVKSGLCKGNLGGTSLHERLAEYAILYGQAPPDGWFGWDFYEEA
jgi:hypothetical protein